VLLWRSWRKSGARLLFWSALCFAALSVNNVILVLDTLCSSTWTSACGGWWQPWWPCCCCCSAWCGRYD
jgi:hypothetical protein